MSKEYYLLVVCSLWLICTGCKCSVNYVAPEGQILINEEAFYSRVRVNRATHSEEISQLYVEITKCNDFGKNTCKGKVLLLETLQVYPVFEGRDTLRLREVYAGVYTFDLKEHKDIPEELILFLKFTLDSSGTHIHKTKSYQLVKNVSCKFSAH